MTRIKLQNASKIFFRYHSEKNITALRHPKIWLNQWNKNELYALQNISLEIMSGEIVGIIGKNGSGKTTLLKIIAGLYKPNEGKIFTNGKIITLFDVYAGFVRQFSLKRNIMLRCLIHGMSNKKARQAYSSIVKFSDLEDILAYPIKNQSSGIGQRVSLGIALHSNPEILLLDELFVTGDVFIIEKAKEKLHELAKSGSTIVVVSHDIQLIEQLCSRAVLMEQGKIIADGTPSKVIALYTNN